MKILNLAPLFIIHLKLITVFIDTVLFCRLAAVKSAEKGIIFSGSALHSGFFAGRNFDFELNAITHLHIVELAYSFVAFVKSAKLYKPAVKHK